MAICYGYRDLNDLLASRYSGNISWKYYNFWIRRWILHCSWHCCKSMAKYCYWYICKLVNHLQNILIQSKRSSTVDAGSDANDYNETPTNKVCILLQRCLANHLLIVSSRVNDLTHIITSSDWIPSKTVYLIPKNLSMMYSNRLKISLPRRKIAFAWQVTFFPLIPLCTWVCLTFYFYRHVNAVKGRSN